MSTRLIQEIMDEVSVKISTKLKYDRAGCPTAVLSVFYDELPAKQDWKRATIPQSVTTCVKLQGFHNDPKVSR